MESKEEQDSLNIKNQVCFPIYALSKKVVNHYRAILDPLDITYPQYLVLLILWDKGEQTVGQLGESLFLDSGTLTPLLKRMEQKNILTRERSAQDERVVKLKLTQYGIDMKDQAKEIPQKLMQSMGFSLEELSELKSVITNFLNK
ncbi:MarR family winged helix-turn-helix transcriptional regulator [Chryseobacterium sp. T1]